MNRLLAGLIALFLAAPAVAVAQPNLNNLPSGTVVGRTQLGTGPAQAIPFANLTSQLFGSLCKTAGAFGIYNGTTGLWVCSTATAESAHLGATSDVYDFWIARPSSTTGTVLQMQDGKSGNLRTLTAGNTGISLQSLVDTSASGFSYSALSLDTQCQAGTGGACVGINITAQASTSWSPGSGGLPGASAINTVGKSSKGGYVWGSNFVGWCLTTACTELFSTELDIVNQIAGTAQASGIWMVNENTVVPTAGSGWLVSATNSNVGFPTALIYLSNVAGFYPLTTGASIIKSDAATVANGIDLSSLTITTSAFKSNGYNVDGSGNLTALYDTGGAGNTFKIAGTAAGTVAQIQGVVSPAIIRYVFKNINFNTMNTDNALTFTLPTGVTRYTINNVRISAASASISTATAGVFTATGGGGVAIVTTQALTVTATAADTNNNAMQLTIANQNTEAYTDTTLQFRIGTPQGSAATADVILSIVPLT